MSMIVRASAHLFAREGVDVSIVLNLKGHKHVDESMTEGRREGRKESASRSNFTTFDVLPMSSKNIQMNLQSLTP